MLADTISSETVISCKAASPAGIQLLFQSNTIHVKICVSIKGFLEQQINPQTKVAYLLWDLADEGLDSTGKTYAEPCTYLKTLLTKVAFGAMKKVARRRA